MTTKLSLSSVVVVIVAILAMYYFPSLFKPHRIKGSRDVLSSSKVISLSSVGAVAGESIEFDNNGVGPYTGVADGRVLRWEGDAVGWTTFAITSPHRRGCTKPASAVRENVCGRPLGLQFERKSGNLYIADCYFGLLVVGPEGGLAKQVIGEVEDRPLHFTNAIDIDEENDIIYFTDTSEKYYIRDFLKLGLTQEASGRLIKYDKVKKESTVLMRNLAFPNGVALSKDRSFILVAESTGARIWRYWLSGPKTGTQEIFSNLPGSPDNIRRNSKGEFWVALHAKGTTFGSILMSNRWLAKLLLNTLDSSQIMQLLVGGQPHAAVVKLGENGEILDILEDSEGRTLRYLSEAYEKDGKLWMGSIITPYIGIYDL